jgi:hypothetical protein
MLVQKIEMLFNDRQNSPCRTQREILLQPTELIVLPKIWKVTDVRPENMGREMISSMKSHPPPSIGFLCRTCISMTNMCGEEICKRKFVIESITGGLLNQNKQQGNEVCYFHGW